MGEERPYEWCHRGYKHTSDDQVQRSVHSALQRHQSVLASIMGLWGDGHNDILGLRLYAIADEPIWSCIHLLNRIQNTLWSKSDSLKGAPYVGMMLTFSNGSSISFWNVVSRDEEGITVSGHYLLSLPSDGSVMNSVVVWADCNATKWTYITSNLLYSGTKAWQCICNAQIHLSTVRLSRYGVAIGKTLFFAKDFVERINLPAIAMKYFKKTGLSSGSALSAAVPYTETGQLSFLVNSTIYVLRSDLTLLISSKSIMRSCTHCKQED